MTGLLRTQSETLKQRLAELMTSQDVVGASVAVTDGTRLDQACWGETRYGSASMVTPSTVFQIGSITKIYTATVVLRLMEQGLLGLDDPFRLHVPEFLPKDSELAGAVTVRHLLAHTSGLEGNFVPDTGRGDDCLTKLVEECRGIGQIQPPGRTYDYCNSGYALLGRLIEKLTSSTWDAAIVEYILAPCGLSETMTLPEQVLLHDAAVGYFPGSPNSTTRWARPEVWSVHRAAGPAGTICATPSDVARFATHHFQDVPQPLLQSSSIDSMLRDPVAIPDAGPETACGLGWHMRLLADTPVIGHTGGNTGQGGQLWLDPINGIAVCVLVNGLNSDTFLEAVLERVFEHGQAMYAAGETVLREGEAEHDQGLLRCPVGDRAPVPERRARC